MSQACQGNTHTSRVSTSTIANSRYEDTRRSFNAFSGAYHLYRCSYRICFIDLRRKNVARLADVHTTEGDLANQDLNIHMDLGGVLAASSSHLFCKSVADTVCSRITR